MWGLRLVLSGKYLAPVFAAIAVLWPLALARASTSPCALQMFEGAEFTVCAFDASAQTLRLVTYDRSGVPLRAFANLARSLGKDRYRVRFAMNAGMFGDHGAPIGLYVENGKTRHGVNMRSGIGNFYMKANGVFSIGTDGTMRIEPTENYIARKARPVWATQSGPLLVIAGTLHDQIAPDGPSRYVRNGVGLRDESSALFVISDEPVSFGKLARFFRDELKCNDALYFDGAVSSLWVPATHRQDDSYNLGPMVVVLDRPKSGAN
jgi:uncharacterized protein YigE (DUF2233 family)